MYRTELHTILLGALECAKWTRSTRDSEHKDTHLVRTVELPLLKGRGAVAPIANRTPHNYYGPGILLPACYLQKPKRISLTEAGKSKKTNSYILLEQAQNYERSCFLRIGGHDLHVDVIGSRQDGLLTFLYKRADDMTLEVCTAVRAIVVPYEPSAIKIGDIERGNVLTKPSLPGRKVRIFEEDVPRISI